MTTPPTPLYPKRPLPLPQIILKAEKDTLPTHHLLNALDRLLLLRHARPRRPIRLFPDSATQSPDYTSPSQDTPLPAYEAQ